MSSDSHVQEQNRLRLERGVSLKMIRVSVRWQAWVEKGRGEMFKSLDCIESYEGKLQLLFLSCDKEIRIYENSIQIVFI